MTRFAPLLLLAGLALGACVPDNRPNSYLGADQYRQHQKDFWTRDDDRELRVGRYGNNVHRYGSTMQPTGYTERKKGPYEN